MVEEKSRDRHKKAILRLKEKALVTKANAEIEALDKLKTKLVQKGEDDKMPKVKKKQRSVLLKLKEKQKEIARMREILKVGVYYFQKKISLRNVKKGNLFIFIFSCE